MPGDAAQLLEGTSRTVKKVKGRKEVSPHKNPHQRSSLAQ